MARWVWAPVGLDCGTHENQEVIVLRVLLDEWVKTPGIDRQSKIVTMRGYRFVVLDEGLSWYKGSANLRYGCAMS